MEWWLLAYLGAVGVGNPSPNTAPSVAFIPHPDSVDLGKKLKVWGPAVVASEAYVTKGGISPAGELFGWSVIRYSGMESYVTLIIRYVRTFLPGSPPQKHSSTQDKFYFLMTSRFIYFWMNR